MPNPNNTETNYRWYILTIAALTFTFSMAMQTMALPVLFKEIAEGFQLTRVQVGWVWGLGSLAGIVTGLMGGSLGDRYGVRRTLMVACFLAGISGALRGLATGFGTLLLSVFLFGLVTTIIPMNVHKACGVWFPRRQLGLANGVVAAGMALGFVLSARFSATTLSPWLGGWRNVLFAYGVVSMLMSIAWLFSKEAYSNDDLKAQSGSSTTMKATFVRIAKLKQIWLLGFAILGISGCIQGTLGYVSLYLTDIGWDKVMADNVLTSFHITSLIAVIPIALLSDRLGSRKRLLMLATLMFATGVGLLSIADGVLVWVAVIMAGFFRDGFMALFMARVIEVDGVGPQYASTAMGLIMVFLQVGNFLSPPLGNSLTAFGPSLPFLFWMCLALLGLLCLAFLSDEKQADTVLTAEVNLSSAG